MLSYTQCFKEIQQATNTVSLSISNSQLAHFPAILATGINEQRDCSRYDVLQTVADMPAEGDLPSSVLLP